MAVEFKTGGPRFQFQQIYQWIPQFGVHYAVGVDGIALVLILMSGDPDAGGRCWPRGTTSKESPNPAGVRAAPGAA